jgi:hypothetical protein
MVRLNKATGSAATAGQWCVASGRQQLKHPENHLQMPWHRQNRARILTEKHSLIAGNFGLKPNKLACTCHFTEHRALARQTGPRTIWPLASSTQGVLSLHRPQAKD